MGHYGTSMERPTRTCQWDILAFSLYNTHPAQYIQRISQFYSRGPALPEQSHINNIQSRSSPPRSIMHQQIISTINRYNMHILNQINTHDIQCIYIMIEQINYAKMEQSNHNTMEQSNWATGTSKPHVLQLSTPVLVSILPQPCNPTTLSTTCRESLQHLVTKQ